jgi:hypothetical protein
LEDATVNGAEALRAARDAGVVVGVDGDDLILEASAPPPAAILDSLSHHKPEVLALLRATHGDRCKYCGKGELAMYPLLTASTDGEVFLAHRSCLDIEFASWSATGSEAAS